MYGKNGRFSHTNHQTPNARFTSRQAKPNVFKREMHMLTTPSNRE
ncbi:MAG: hypothetical protein R3C62_11965 [Chloroflexota bacterium]